MIDLNGRLIRLGDKVSIGSGIVGIVVCSMDTDEYSDACPKRSGDISVVASSYNLHEQGWSTWKNPTKILKSSAQTGIDFCGREVCRSFRALATLERSCLNGDGR